MVIIIHIFDYSATCYAAWRHRIWMERRVWNSGRRTRRSSNWRRSSCRAWKARSTAHHPARISTSSKASCGVTERRTPFCSAPTSFSSEAPDWRTRTGSWDWSSTRGTRRDSAATPPRAARWSARGWSAPWTTGWSTCSSSSVSSSSYSPWSTWASTTWRPPITGTWVGRSSASPSSLWFLTFHLFQLLNWLLDCWMMLIACSCCCSSCSSGDEHDGLRPADVQLHSHLAECVRGGAAHRSLFAHIQRSQNVPRAQRHSGHRQNLQFERRSRTGGPRDIWNLAWASELINMIELSGQVLVLRQDGHVNSQRDGIPQGVHRRSALRQLRRCERGAAVRPSLGWVVHATQFLKRRVFVPPGEAGHLVRKQRERKKERKKERKMEEEEEEEKKSTPTLTHSPHLDIKVNTTKDYQQKREKEKEGSS